MPASVNNPRAADQLRREYDVLGERIQLTLDDTVVPVAVVADLSPGSSGLPTIRRAYARFTQAAVAGEYCVWRIETPPGVAVILRRFHVITAAAGLGRAHWGSSIAAPANISTNTQLMDGRLRAQQGETPAVVVSYGTQVALLAAPYMTFGTGVGAGYDNIVEWIAGRDDESYDFIEFEYLVVNQAVDAYLEWDEVSLR